MQSDLRIVASLDIPNSVTEINKDIPKLEEKLKHLKVKIDPDTNSLIKEIQAYFNETNNKANFKIIARLNVEKSVQLIQSDLNDIINKANVTNKEELTDYLDSLDMAKSKFKSLVEFYKGIDQRRKSLDQMIETWKNQGIYVGELEAQFEKLRAELDIVSKAGLTDGLSKWITQYNKAMNSVGIDPAKQEQLNSYLNEQIRMTKIILSLRAKIAGIDPNKNPEKLAGLQQQLSAREKELSILQQQNSSMNALMTAEQQKQYIIQKIPMKYENLLTKSTDITRTSTTFTKNRQKL